MADGDRFDPRYDPSFQRGFDGEAAPPAPEHQVTMPPSRPAVEQPGDVIERPRELPPEDQLPRRTRPAPNRLDDEDSPAQRRNPFLIATIVIAGLLIVGGALIFARLPELRANVQGESVVDYQTLDALTIAAPLFIALGIATIVAVLLFSAARWRRAPVVD